MVKVKIDKAIIKNQVIDALRRGSKGDIPERSRDFIDCLFEKSNQTHSKYPDFVTDTIICKNVWEKLFIKKGKGSCHEQKQQKIQNYINNKYKEINYKLHGKYLSQPFNKKVDYYLKRVRVGLVKGLVSIFSHEEIVNCISEDKKIIDLRNKKHKRIIEQQYYKLGKDKIPWVSCEVSIDEGFDRDALTVMIDKKWQKVPNSIEYTKYLSLICAKNRKADVENKEKTFPGLIFGLYKYRAGKKRKTGKPTIKFTLKKSNYFKFLAIQELLKNKKLRRQYFKVFEKTKPIPEIAHTISVTLFITIIDCGEEKAIFSQRSNRGLIGTGQNLWALCVDETFRRNIIEEEYKELKRREKANLKFNEDKGIVYNVAVRGVKKELGINLPKEKIKFLAFGLETNRYLYNIVGIAQTGMSREYLENCLGTAEHRSHEYVGPPEYVPFTRQEVYDFWINIEPEKRCPIAQMASYFALCHVDSTDKVARFFESYPNPRNKLF
jgi:hypothetical protein